MEVNKINSEILLEDLEKTIKKMIRLALGGTGCSEVYRDMLLSILPNSKHKVNMSYWIYKADSDDFDMMLQYINIARNNYEIIEFCEKIILPYKDKLIKEFE